MIYLKQRNIIFLKAKKVAGTSFEIALSKYSDDPENDIITPIEPTDELVRLEHGGKSPVNWAHSREVEKEFDRFINELNDLSSFPRANDFSITQFIAKNMEYFSRRELTKFRGHISASALRSKLGEENFRKARKVSIIRDPVEQAVSRLYYKLRDEPDITIGDARWIENIKEHLEFTNRKYYFIRNEPIFDFLIRYEHLEQDLKLFDRKFGTEVAKNMPKTKHNIRQDRRPASEILNREQIRLVYEKNIDIYEKFDFYERPT